MFTLEVNPTGAVLNKHSTESSYLEDKFYSTW